MLNLKSGKHVRLFQDLKAHFPEEPKKTEQHDAPEPADTKNFTGPTDLRILRTVQDSQASHLRPDSVGYRQFAWILFGLQAVAEMTAPCQGYTPVWFVCRLERGFRWEISDEP